jgi:glycosyltransferase involved in cell wall biosynthesis
VSGAALDVAVVIPVRDGEAHLAEALSSVLSQDLAPVEILVVDDGSTDRSAEVARAAGPRIEVLSTPPRGAGAARNLGVASTRAPWIAFLDADDVWEPAKLSRQTRALAATPGAVACIGLVRQFFDRGLARAGVPNPEVLGGPTPSTLLVERAAFLATGGYPTDRVASEAAAWWVAFEALSPVVVRVPEVLARRRLHTKNMGVVRAAEARSEFLRLAKEALDRRRGGPA